MNCRNEEPICSSTSLAVYVGCSPSGNSKLFFRKRHLLLFPWIRIRDERFHEYQKKQSTLFWFVTILFVFFWVLGSVLGWSIEKIASWFPDCIHKPKIIPRYHGVQKIGVSSPATLVLAEIWVQLRKNFWPPDRQRAKNAVSIDLRNHKTNGQWNSPTTKRQFLRQKRSTPRIVTNFQTSKAHLLFVLSKLNLQVIQFNIFCYLTVQTATRYLQ